MVQPKIIISGRDDSRAAFASASRSLDALDAKAGVLASTLPAVAAALATAFVIDRIKGAVDLLDQLDDISEKSGIAVESLSALRFAGEATGTSFESLTDGTRKLARQMAEAAGGNKDAVQLFKQLGVEVKNADGSLRDTDAVLLDLADRFSSYGDGAGKAALAQQVFGKSGAELIPILNQGSAGLRDLRKEADALGIIFGAEQAKEAAQFNDQLSKINQTLDGIAAATASKVLPLINRLLSESLEAFRVFGNGFEAFKQLGFGGISGGLIGNATGNLGVAKTEVSRLEGALKNLQDTAARRPLDAAQQQFKDLTLQQLEVAQKKVTYYERILGLTDKAGAGRGSQGSELAVREQQAPVITSAPKAPAKEAAVTTRLATSDIDSLLGNNALQRAQEYAAQLERIDELFFGGFVSGEQYDALLKALTKTQVEAGSATSKFADDQARLSQILAATPSAELERQRQDMQLLADAYLAGALNAEQYAEAVATALPQATEAAQGASDLLEGVFGNSFGLAARGEFDQILQYWESLIADMLAKAVAADLVRALGGSSSNQGIADLLNGFFGSSGGATVAGARAGGGPVWPGAAFLVGERGPEMFVPRGPGQILNAQQLGGGGVVINQTLNVGSGVSRSEVAAAMVMGRDAAVRAVSESFRRNGGV